VRALKPQLEASGMTVEVLESDEVRRVLTPEATYSQVQRESLLSRVGADGAKLVAHGVTVIFDATATKRAYRDFARNLIPRFIEVAVECPLETCMQRDTRAPISVAGVGSRPPYRGCSPRTNASESRSDNRYDESPGECSSRNRLGACDGTVSSVSRPLLSFCVSLSLKVSQKPPAGVLGYLFQRARSSKRWVAPGTMISCFSQVISS